MLGVRTVLAVCVLGGLQAHGVIELPQPAPVRDAIAQVRTQQDRAVTSYTCRQIVLTAEEELITAAQVDGSCSPRR